MTYQPSLFNQEYIPDKWIVGEKTVKALHEDHSNSMMRRPFISWDGEGYTDEYGGHHYWLLANSAGDKLIAPPGRSIERHNIARLMREIQERNYNAIHSGFALGYDFTCILRSNGFKTGDASTLYRKGYLKADGYTWKLMMGKTLTVYPTTSTNEGRRFLLQDSWGFFQSSFINALDSYFGTTWPYRDIIIEMKAKRSKFDRSQDEEVLSYNDMELELLVMLMEELRDRLYQAGMPISRWYGPGAIANGLLGKWKIKSTLVNLYSEKPEIAAASAYAYAGGRFELLKPGHANAPVFQYDINSAYPWAIADLPNLKSGYWEYKREPTLDELTPFSVALIEWDTDIPYTYLITPDSFGTVYPESIPFPFWRRSQQGRISYPSHGVRGWYWQPEIEQAVAYSQMLEEQYNIKMGFKIQEAWVFYDSGERPFSQVPLLYETRQQLKARGNGAHVGIKLGLNSLYGKFAQQIGWNPDTPNRFPPYHNIALAGWVTAKCRAKLLSAIALDPDSIIATETDAVFSLKPLPLPISNRLGEWEETRYDDIWYFASGFRFGVVDGDIKKPATRGIPVKDISLDAIRSEISTSLSSLKVKQTQFVTLNWAMAMNRQYDMGQWREMDKELHLMCEDPVGKRIHHWDCPACMPQEAGYRVYSWDMPHITVPNPAGAYQMSAMHDIAWLRTDKKKSEPQEEMIFDV